MGLLWNNDASMSRKAFNGISKIFKYDRWKFENYIKQEENYKDWEYNEKEAILKNKHGLEKWYKARKKEEERKQMYSNTYGTTRSTNQHIPSSFSSSLPPFIPIPSTAEPIRNIVKSKLLSIKEMKAFIKMDTLISTWAWNVDQAREALLALSSQLRAIKPCLSSGNDNHLHMSKKEMDIKNNGASTAQMLSDLLIMYAHTETFFVPHRYGQPRVVRTHDVAVVDVPGTSRVDLMNVPIATAEEGYGYIRTTETGVINKDSTVSSSSSSSSSTSSSSSYAVNATKTSTVGFEIHDELLNWNVQSKEDYIATTSTFQSSIRMGDLGVAYLPSIASCFSKSKINYNTKYYTSTSRRTMIEHLTETPFGCWNNSYELNALFNATENLGQNGVDKEDEEDEEDEEEEEEEEDDVVYGSPMFDDLLSTLDSSSSLSSNPGPSTTAVLNVLKSALSKKLSTKKDDAAVEKVMAGLTIGKENSFEIFFFLDYFH